MPEPMTSSGPPGTLARPFPWSCPKCRRKEVRRATIAYQCQRLHNGKPITLALPNLSVPRCDHCGELVFDYDAEEQIKQELSKESTAIDLSALESVRTEFERQQAKEGCSLIPDH